MTKKDPVEQDEYHKKKGMANFQKILVTSLTGVKIQSISLITNMEI